MSTEQLTHLHVQLYPAGVGLLRSERVNGDVIRYIERPDRNSIPLTLRQREWDKVADALSHGHTTYVTCNTGIVWSVQRYTDVAGTQWVHLAHTRLSSEPFSVRLVDFNCLKED